MWEAVLRQRMTALATLGAPLGIQRQTIPTTVVHLAGEPFGEKGAGPENANKNRQIEQCIHYLGYRPSFTPTIPNGSNRVDKRMSMRYRSCFMAQKRHHHRHHHGHHKVC